MHSTRSRCLWDDETVRELPNAARRSGRTPCSPVGRAPHLDVKIVGSMARRCSAAQWRTLHQGLSGDARYLERCRQDPGSHRAWRNAHGDLANIRRGRLLPHSSGESRTGIPRRRERLPREIEEFLHRNPDSQAFGLGVPTKEVRRKRARGGSSCARCDALTKRRRPCPLPRPRSSLQVPRYVRMVKAFPTTVTGKSRSSRSRAEIGNWFQLANEQRGHAPEFDFAP